MSMLPWCGTTLPKDGNGQALHHVHSTGSYDCRSARTRPKASCCRALLGFVVSAGVIVVMTLLDDTYKTTEDIKKYTGLVTMAVIPLEKSDGQNFQRADKQDRPEAAGRENAEQT